MSDTLVHPNLDRVAVQRSRQVTEHRRAFWGIMACFLVHGLVVSTWVSRIASVKSALHLGDGALGLALLGTASAPSPPSRSPARWWCATAAA
jgi:hypothetical protein